ncbi:hypothetical protein PF010_g30058 [Phytophthora fragariae]|uniref:Uncharacterized protein n=2 Tax=Phytophthora fragariae TaxID=53985 RepID=A0A6G0JLG6_9STRA|nr:hypothetical protein PF010_g30058 [Phytophthora fragariae]
MPKRARDEQDNGPGKRRRRRQPGSAPAASGLGGVVAFNDVWAWLRNAGWSSEPPPGEVWIHAIDILGLEEMPTARRVSTSFLARVPCFNTLPQQMHSQQSVRTAVTATRATTSSKRASKQPPRMIEAKNEDVEVVPVAAVVVSQMVQQPLKPVRAATESTAPPKRPHKQTPWLPGQHAPVLSKAKDEAVDVVPAAAS